MLRAKVEDVLTPKRATLAALVVFALASWGDAVTTAEATFTLFYVVPQAMVVWFAGLRTAYLLVGLSVASGAAVDLNAGRATNWHFFVWNQLIDAGLYLVFVHVLAALRARVKLESELRREALSQLRHAERLTTIGKLASGVAHEIGTPLNVISGYAELLMASRLGAADIKESGRILLEQSERVEKIVHQLLDFSRRGGTHVDATDLLELATTTAELLTTLAKKSGIDIVTSGDAVVANVNRSEIQQVLTNLLTNAIQAMPDGGRVSVQVSLERSQSPSGRGRNYDCAVLRVKDDGGGIAPDIVPKIFDPFFTTKDVGQGTGLGLSVAYGIVNDHGGWIDVDTRLGHGTTFTVYLPKVAA